MKILEEFWYGTIQPRERRPTDSPRRTELTHLIISNEDKLMSYLSDEAKDIYERLKDNRAELIDMDECEAFMLGFRIAARMTFEAMNATDVKTFGEE